MIKIEPAGHVKCNSCNSFHLRSMQVAAKTIGAIRGKDMEKTVSQSTGTCKPLTTFVQTDTNAFREIVQRLTGPSESDPPAPKVSGVRRSTSKLHERRQYLRPKLEIIKPAINFRPCTSPSPVGTPSSVFSKLSIQEKENKEASAALELNNEEEEKAIKERRFYLHPSPRSKPGYSEPELLTLFPLTSPTTSEKP